ncbi:MAG: hypothetical protein EAZ97_14790, partial [Bacteroidetes bacterium]
EDFVEKNLAENERNKAKIILKDQEIAQNKLDLQQKELDLKQKDQKLFETAKELKRLGLHFEQISKLTGFSFEQIQNLD